VVSDGPYRVHQWRQLLVWWEIRGGKPSINQCRTLNYERVALSPSDEAAMLADLALFIEDMELCN
jgi:hypothetical protein